MMHFEAHSIGYSAQQKQASEGHWVDSEWFVENKGLELSLLVKAKQQYTVKNPA